MERNFHETTTTPLLLRVGLICAHFETPGRGAANGLKLLESLYQRPIFTVGDVSDLLNMTPQAANGLTARLLQLGLVREITGQQRNRVFRYDSYVALFLDRCLLPWFGKRYSSAAQHCMLPPMTGLVSAFWVQAYLTRLRLQEIPAFVTAHGDNDAGAVLVKINTLDGQATAFQRGYDLNSGARRWVELSSGAEPDVDAAIGRQKEFDPDLWVIEVEDRQGRTLLDEPGLE